MKSFLWQMMAALVFLTPVSALAEDEATVSVSVVKKELKYVGECTWAVYEKAMFGLPNLLVEKLALEKTHKVSVGNYLGVVSCPSTEGTLRQTKNFKIESFQTEIGLSFKMVPAFLLVDVKRDEKQLTSSIWVYDQWGIRVATGIDHAVMVVPAERLWVYARPDQYAEDNASTASAIGVKASGQIKMSPMKKNVLKLDVTPAYLKVSLKNNGKRAKGVVTLLTKGGKPILDWESSEQVEVPPGSYQIKTQIEESHDFLPQIKRELKILPGTKKSITISHQTGKVRTVVRLGGKRVTKRHPQYDAIEIALHRAGVPTGFNSVASGERAILSPGSYDLYAQMKQRTLDDGTPWQVVKRIDVDPRGDYSFELDLTPAQISLETMLGEEGSSVHISLLRLDDDVKVFESQTDNTGRGIFRIQPGGYRLQANPNPTNPELTQEQLIDVKEGQQLNVRMEIPLGKVMIQVFNDEGVAIWCDIGLFRDGASKPLWTFKGGEEIWVPAGTYEVQARYQGGRHSFGPVRVSSGRTAERQVIWP